jgi:hypothetical protein
VGLDCPNPCDKECPVNALAVRRNPTFDTIGDFRWTPDLLASTWTMAETGSVPKLGLEYRIGKSEGGFDKLRLVLPSGSRESQMEDEIDTGVISTEGMIMPTRSKLRSPSMAGECLMVP